ncbi:MULTISPECIES: hypothetical protein [Halocynthiibacter]|uniref:Uncharacterized protein n=1 Tax=Halocynthiibacter halioticoli TaxID=2986804 RepID=A0AAE3LRY7_9RHOB|nr:MULTISPECIES: hypothetical protein [Halocynthiibacter]MCV6825987.1 hypothetical protein [Halocynthiibacter halioticoli]MCW4058988.1 hypothetical protein [Halocynthiibacter sp. SDUM655004]
MAVLEHLTEFTAGETIEFSAALKKDGAAWPDASNSQVALIIGSGSNSISTEIHRFTTAPQVNLVDIPGAVWSFFLQEPDYNQLSANSTYRYEIWVSDAGNNPSLQLKGNFRLNSAIGP